MPRFDASGGGIDWNNPITRRRFLKRTGAASAATMLALHGMKVEVLASGGVTVNNCTLSNLHHFTLGSAHGFGFHYELNVVAGSGSNGIHYRLFIVTTNSEGEETETEIYTKTNWRTASYNGVGDETEQASALTQIPAVGAKIRLAVSINGKRYTAIDGTW